MFKSVKHLSITFLKSSFFPCQFSHDYQKRAWDISPFHYIVWQFAPKKHELNPHKGGRVTIECFYLPYCPGSLISLQTSVPHKKWCYDDDTVIMMGHNPPRVIRWPRAYGGGNGSGGDWNISVFGTRGAHNVYFPPSATLKCGLPRSNKEFYPQCWSAAGAAGTGGGWEGCVGRGRGRLGQFCHPGTRELATPTHQLMSHVRRVRTLRPTLTKNMQRKRNH